jgi:high affinity Mn2+ porin
MYQLLCLVSFILGSVAWAGAPPAEVRPAEVQDSNLHIQSTVVSQEHGNFSAHYSGRNSLSRQTDQETSITWTVFAGKRLWQGAEFYVDPELAGGSGFNKTEGMAGFPNGEIYRVSDPAPKWSLARIYVKQVFGLGDSQEEIKEDKNQLASSYDQKRFTIIGGRFSLNDFFDNNTYSHDPRTQFLNWVLMDNGAWDYAADTKGYSWGLYLEYNQPEWALRFASVMIPKQANQMQFDESFPKARGDNLEFEYRYLASGHPGVARILAYENYADMGSYQTTIDNSSYNMDITQSRSMRVKYGFGINLEQELTKDLGTFFRASWNDGRTETWNFTEIDQAVSAGLSMKGSNWGRESDTVGVALIVNGLSKDHKDYLRLGGYGFIIGDGKLSYAPEEIAEMYYLFKVMHELDLTGDYQFAEHPAYNSARGPVSIFSMRLHYEI